VRPTRCNK